MPVNMKGKSFLTLMDLSAREIRFLLDLAQDLKAKKRAGLRGSALKGKNIALLLEKDSTRTRCSFEVAVRDEGGGVTCLDPASARMGRKESLEDTARVLGRFFDGIAYQGFDRQAAADLAKYSGVPVFNGLTGLDHPAQILADMMTMEEHISKPLRDCKVAFVGDVRNNMSYAWMSGCCKMGVDFVGYGPKALIQDADQELLRACQAEGEKAGAHIKLSDSVDDLKGADVLCSDVWASMGEEALIPERARLLSPYRIDEKLLKATGSPNVIFMHCLPSFHDFNTKLAQEWKEKGIDIREVTDEVFRGRHSVVFDEAENRMHTIKAVMVAAV